LHFAVILIAFLIGYLMPRARVLTAITLIVLALVAIGVWPIWSSAQTRGIDRPTANERVVRLMSFNTRLKNHKADAVADEVLRVDPDIAVLIEFGEEKRSALDKLRARYPYQADCIAKENCYIAIIAKAPLVDVETRGPWEGPPLVKASFGPEYGNLTVVGIHTLRFPYQASHLRQIGALALYLEALSGAKVVAGDFNATPYSRILSTFSDRSHLDRLTNLPTWPSQLQLPQLAIDHVFAGRGVRSVEAPRIGRNAGSDHYPVIVGLGVGDR
jgi:endonuclease/exonuclease/phosphatase (EEP) superfamily protein YafD